MLETKNWFVITECTYQQHMFHRRNTTRTAQEQAQQPKNGPETTQEQARTRPYLQAFYSLQQMMKESFLNILLGEILMPKLDASQSFYHVEFHSKEHIIL